MNRRAKFLPCTIVCHGECEYIIAKQIQNKRRRNLNILADKNGKKCIEINTLTRFILEKYPTKNAYINKNRDYLLIEKETKEILQHKLFPIMDKDQTKDNVFESYKNGQLFNNYWFGDNGFIIPIYFYPDLDEVFNNNGFKIDIRKHKPAQYFKYLTTQYDKVELMLRNLKIEESNIRVLFDYLDNFESEIWL